MSVTRNDVARLAGVFSATVSHTVNNGPRPVSEETRKMVQRDFSVLGKTDTISMEDLSFGKRIIADRLTLLPLQHANLW